MSLPCDKSALSSLSEDELRGAILERRRIIRGHRDQLGDDRCWLDDYLVWAMIDGSPSLPVTLPPFEAGMEQCRQFYRFRQALYKDQAPPEAILDRNRWDKDLLNMTVAQLLDEQSRIQEAIRRHRDITGRPRTVQDDRAL